MEPYEMWLDSDWVRQADRRVVVMGHPVDNSISGLVNPDHLEHVHGNLYLVSGPVEWF